MSNSALVSYTKISPNSTNPRQSTIKKITIHHMAGNLTVESCGSVFADSSRQASSNYGIDGTGKVGMYVEEKNRSWCSSSSDNDHQAVTIEVANDGGSPDWHVSDVAFAKLIDLCVDICQRNGIDKLNYTGDATGNLTMHKWFKSTTCPGPYLEGKFSEIADAVNLRLGSGEVTSDALYRVQVGAYSKLENAVQVAEELAGKGIDTYLVQANGLYKVQVGAYAKEANAKAQAETLEKLGYDTYITTVSGTSVSVTSSKSVEELAKEVIAGEWGNGEERKSLLTAAGYDYSAVQQKVNELLG